MRCMGGVSMIQNRYGLCHIASGIEQLSRNANLLKKLKRNKKIKFGKNKIWELFV